MARHLRTSHVTSAVCERKPTRHMTGAGVFKTYWPFAAVSWALVRDLDEAVKVIRLSSRRLRAMILESVGKSPILFLGRAGPCVCALLNRPLSAYGLRRHDRSKTGWLRLSRGRHSAILMAGERRATRRKVGLWCSRNKLARCPTCPSLNPPGRVVAISSKCRSGRNTRYSEKAAGISRSPDLCPACRPIPKAISQKELAGDTL